MPNIIYNEGQETDTKPGDYYVTCTDAGRVGWLVGPFRDDHAAALAAVDEARRIGQDMDPRACFYAWGTARTEYNRRPEGLLNKHKSEWANL